MAPLTELQVRSRRMPVGLRSCTSSQKATRQRRSNSVSVSTVSPSGTTGTSNLVSVSTSRREPSSPSKPHLQPLVMHAFVFVALLVATILVAQTVEQNAALLIILIAVPGTVIILVSLGLTTGVLKQRTRHRIVVAKNPGATVVPAEWSSAVLAPFLNNASAVSSNYRGFGVEIAASKAGVSLWRSQGVKNVELLGNFDWSQVDSIEEGTVDAVIGRRVAPTIRFNLRHGADSPFKDQIELLIRKIPVDEAVAALQQARS